MGITNLDILNVDTSVRVAGVVVLAGQQAAQANTAGVTSSVISTATPAAAPAGNVGAAAGGWDTAASRDAAIVTINGLRDIAVEVKTDHDTLLTDVNALRTTLNALLAKLRTHGIIAT